MRSRASLVALVIAIASIAHAERVPRAASLAVQPLELGNGLRVVLAPDPTSSSVVVHVRYGGGAGDESDRQAGFTHLVEQLMFAGSVHVKSGAYDAHIDGAGGFTGSTSSADHLSVFEQVPAGALELALWLEAERMAGLADGITDAGIATARDVIASEVRSAYVDQPYALVAREVQRALWPAGHRYQRDVLGDAKALAAATRDSVRAFVRERIRPGNATLVIAGKLDVAATTALVRRYFAWIPDQRVPPPKHDAVTPLAAPVKLRVADPVAKVVVAFRLPSPRDPDFLTLQIAARELESRLQPTLVDKGLANDVHLEVVRHENGGELRITAAPGGATYDEIAASVLRLITEVFRVPFSDAPTTTSVETELLIALEGLIYRADALARWHSYEGADYLDRLPERLRTIDAVSLHRIASRWLSETAAVVVIGGPEAR